MIDYLKKLTGEPVANKDALLSMIEWISDEGAAEADERLFIAGLGERLRSLNFPIDRVTFHVMTLHPDYVGRTVAWAPGEEVEVLDREQGSLPILARSPFYKVMRTARLLVVGPDDEHGHWQDIDVFSGRSLTQLIIAPLSHEDGPVSVVAFGSARAIGFLPSERQVIERMMPTLRNAWELHLLRQEDPGLLGDWRLTRPA
jgi:adenylate cyclase